MIALRLESSSVTLKVISQDEPGAYRTNDVALPERSQRHTAGA
jgi:hypothetical protein